MIFESFANINRKDFSEVVADYYGCDMRVAKQVTDNLFTGYGYLNDMKGDEFDDYEKDISYKLY